jgi:hypothetical protein
MAVGDTVKIRDASGRVIHTSRNLRGILDYSRGRCVIVERVDLFPLKHSEGGTMGITWNTGATCITDFASYRVMVEWAKARRCFKGAEIREVARVL